MTTTRRLTCLVLLLLAAPARRRIPSPTPSWPAPSSATSRCWPPRTWRGAAWARRDCGAPPAGSRRACARSGLRPAFGDRYRQPFRVKAGVALGRARTYSRAWPPPTGRRWGCPAPARSRASWPSPATASRRPRSAIASWTAIDVKGKVVLMLRYEPQEKDDASPFDGRRPSRWSAMRYKVLQARERGAAAVVFVTGPAQDDGKDRLPVAQERRPGERGRPPRAPGEAGGGAALAGRAPGSTSTRSSARWTATWCRARGRPRAYGSPAASTCGRRTTTPRTWPASSRDAAASRGRWWCSARTTTTSASAARGRCVPTRARSTTARTTTPRARRPRSSPRSGWPTPSPARASAARSWSRSSPGRRAASRARPRSSPRLRGPSRTPWP